MVGCLGGVALGERDAGREQREVGQAALVAGRLDQLGGGVAAATRNRGAVPAPAGEHHPPPFELRVGLVEAHAAEPGDLEHLLQIVLGRLQLRFPAPRRITERGP